MLGLVTSGKQTDKKNFYLFILDNKQHINFIGMFLYYFQFLVIHVNGLIFLWASDFIIGLS